MLEFKTYTERKYVEYYLNSIDLTPYITGAAQPKLNKKNLNSIGIPNPPFEEKERIVHVLDLFTELTTELSTALTARSKQYNYYRNQFLIFQEGEVEWKRLDDACDYVDYRGKTPKKTTEGVFLVTAKNIRMGFIDYESSQEFVSTEDYNMVMRRGLPEICLLYTSPSPRDS